MKKLLIIAAMMLLPAMSYAAVEINTNGLNDSEKAQLVTMAEQLKAQKAANSPGIHEVIEPSNAQKWADFAKVFGSTLSATAKEIGVAANDFAQTPVGKMTAFIIVYKYVGSELIDLALTVVGAFSFLGVGIWFLSRFKRDLVEETIEYDLERKNIFGNHPIKSVSRGSLSNHDAAAIFWSHFILLAVFIVIIIAGW